MHNTAKVIHFPKPVKNNHPKRVVNTDGVKYYTSQQIRLLRKTVRDKALADMHSGKVTSIREWMVIDLLTQSGIRVSEAANLRCGDVKTGYGESSIFVRCGKGRRSRTVVIPDSLKKHLKRLIGRVDVNLSRNLEWRMHPKQSNAHIHYVHDVGSGWSDTGDEIEDRKKLLHKVDNDDIHKFGMIPELIGAFVGRFYLLKKFGKQWRQYAPVLLAGYGCGMGLVAMASVAIALIAKSVSMLSY